MCDVLIRAALPGDVDEVLALWAHARSLAAATADTAEGVTLPLERDPRRGAGGRVVARGGVPAR